MDQLTLECAQRIVVRATQEAIAAFKRPICVAVCDSYGFLLAFGRMEGTPIRSIQISQGKAYTAVRMGISTDTFLARLRQNQFQPSYFCDSQLTALPGGNLLKDKVGTVVGGVGVSGLTGDEDQAISEAMAALFAAGEL
jgi:glc operon protein GlcG